MTLQRSLTPLEATLDTLGRTANLYNVITIAQVRGPLTAEILHQALAGLQQRHRPLRWVIRPEPGKDLAFYQPQELKLPLTVTIAAHPSDWQQRVTAACNTPLASDQFLLRLEWVRGPEPDRQVLILTLHHAISEGRSSLYLHSTLLDYCGQLLAGVQPNITPLDLVPSLSEQLPAPYRGFGGWLKSWGTLLQLQLRLGQGGVAALPIQRFVPVADRRSGFVQHWVGPELVDRLRLRARQEGTTVHSALLAAMSLIVARKLASHPASTDQNGPNSGLGSARVGKSSLFSFFCKLFGFKIPTAHPAVTQSAANSARILTQSPIDLRPRLVPPVPAEPLCLMISSLSTAHQVSPDTDFWTLGREVAQQLDWTTQRDTSLSLYRVADWVLRVMTRWPDRLLFTIGVTNVGIVNLPPRYGDLTLEQLSFLPSPSRCAGAWELAVVTFQGTMALTCGFVQGATTETEVAQRLRELVAVLEQNC